MGPDGKQLSPAAANEIRQRCLKKRRQLCRFFAQGKCQNGLSCIWAHGEDELEVPNGQDPKLLKTRLCTHFMNGWCAQGKICPFAHGKSELRQAERGGRKRARDASDGKPGKGERESRSVSTASRESRSRLRRRRRRRRAEQPPADGLKADVPPAAGSVSCSEYSDYDSCSLSPSDVQQRRPDDLDSESDDELEVKPMMPGNLPRKLEPMPLVQVSPALPALLPLPAPPPVKAAAEAPAAPAVPQQQTPALPMAKSQVQEEASGPIVVAAAAAGGAPTAPPAAPPGQAPNAPAPFPGHPHPGSRAKAPGAGPPTGDGRSSPQAAPTAKAGAPQAAHQNERPVLVSNCSDRKVCTGVHGVYHPCGTNHARPYYRRCVGSVAAAYMYFWDERDGPDLSGWWMGPKLGGEHVWVHHPCRASLLPPERGWHAPHDGPLDAAMTVRPLSDAEVAAEEAGSTAAALGTTANASPTAPDAAAPANGQASAAAGAGDAAAQTKTELSPPGQRPGAPTGGTAGVKSEGIKREAATAQQPAKKRAVPAKGNTGGVAAVPAAPKEQDEKKAVPGVKAESASKQEEGQGKAAAARAELADLEKKLRAVRQEGQDHLRQLAALTQSMEAQKKEEERLLVRIRQVVAPLVGGPAPQPQRPAPPRPAATKSKPPMTGSSTAPAAAGAETAPAAIKEPTTPTVESGAAAAAPAAALQAPAEGS